MRVTQATFFEIQPRPLTLYYQIRLFGPIGADVRHPNDLMISFLPTTNPTSVGTVYRNT